MKSQETQNRQNNFEKKTLKGYTTNPPKSKCFGTCLRNHTDQWNRAKNPEVDTYSWPNHLPQECQYYKWRNDILFNGWHQGNQISTCKIEAQLQFTSSIIINLKWNKNLNVRPKT